MAGGPRVEEKELVVLGLPLIAGIFWRGNRPYVRARRTRVQGGEEDRSSIKRGQDGGGADVEPIPGGQVLASGYPVVRG